MILNARFKFSQGAVAPARFFVGRFIAFLRLKYASIRRIVLVARLSGFAPVASAARFAKTPPSGDAYAGALAFIAVSAPVAARFSALALRFLLFFAFAADDDEIFAPKRSLKRRVAVAFERLS